ncbi:heme/hemin ABC transporter substrate-binding protein [Pseudopedobacter beijingensis]|uniref:Hemin ABC transporter substrate-binding protein n=1 Tax=Pseudopedobacter beijingensis TaxID=1207056 RepID=A0ABW4IFK6_9SPHI
MKRILFLLIICLEGLSLKAAKPDRIITLSSALTETVDAFGYGSKIVATDVTSTYPAYVNTLPKVSRNRSVSLESLASFRPDLILAPEGALSQAVQTQLKALKIKYVIIEQEFSVKGATNFIKAIGVALNEPNKGILLAKQMEAEVNKALQTVKTSMKSSPKVVFIYARGTGTMSVAGKGSSLDAIIKLAGGRNPIQEFSEYKPYTTEALVKANPDVILMFDFGISSLGGKDAVLKMPGMNLINAGKNKKIIAMDGNLLINFSTRLSEAILELNKQLR